jgi:hypothetical protein
VRDLLASPRLFDALALLVLAEWGALVLVKRRSGRGPTPGAATSFLGAGFFLFAALRAVAAGNPPALVGVALLAALGCHLWHLRHLWGVRPGAPNGAPGGAPARRRP